MTILEELSKEDAKRKYRELVLKYHSDRSKDIDDDIIKRINNAKDEGDDALNRIYDELTNKKTKNREETREEWEKRTGRNYDDFKREWEKVKRKRKKRGKKAHRQQRRNPDKKWRK